MLEHAVTYSQAIAEATIQAMDLDPAVFVVGQGTRDRGHIFGSLEGVFEKFGPDRIVEMPIAEGAIAGMCVGASLNALRPILVLQRADFSFLALDQIINHAAKFFFMFGGQTRVPLVIRLIVGKGWGQGPQHSQDLHSMFAHFPGLRVVAPATPYTVKGLLLNSIFSDDPVIIFEGRSLYSQMQSIPEEPYVLPFGQAYKLADGNDISIVAVSFLLPDCLEARNRLAAEGITAEIIDLTSISPLDLDTLLQSVGRTGRLLVVDTSWSFCGISAEISAQVNEHLFGKLKAPIKRLTIPFCPTPTAEKLEKQFYPQIEQIVEISRKMVLGG